MLPSMPRHRAIAFCCLLDGTRSAGRGSTDDKAKAILPYIHLSLSSFQLCEFTNARLHSSRQWKFRQCDSQSGRNRRGDISTVEYRFFGILVCTVFYLYERKAKYAENTMHLRRRRNVCDVANRGNPCDVHPYSKVLMNTCRYRVNKCQT